MCVSQFLGKMFTPLASVQVPSQNYFFYSLFTFTLVLERNSSLIIISQVYVCLYALVYVCVCVWRSAAAAAVLRSLVSFLVSAGTLSWRLTCGLMPTYPLTLPIRFISVCGAARNLKNANFPIGG